MPFFYHTQTSAQPADGTRMPSPARRDAKKITRKNTQVTPASPRPGIISQGPPRRPSESAAQLVEQQVRLLIQHAAQRHRHHVGVIKAQPAPILLQCIQAVSAPLSCPAAYRGVGALSSTELPLLSSSCTAVEAKGCAATGQGKHECLAGAPQQLCKLGKREQTCRTSAV